MGECQLVRIGVTGVTQADENGGGSPGLVHGRDRRWFRRELLGAEVRALREAY